MAREPFPPVIGETLAAMRDAASERAAAPKKLERGPDRPVSRAPKFGESVPPSFPAPRLPPTTDVPWPGRAPPRPSEPELPTRAINPLTPAELPAAVVQDSVAPHGIVSLDAYAGCMPGSWIEQGLVRLDANHMPSVWELKDPTTKAHFMRVFRISEEACYRMSRLPICVDAEGRVYCREEQTTFIGHISVVARAIFMVREMEFPAWMKIQAHDVVVQQTWGNPPPTGQGGYADEARIVS